MLLLQARQLHAMRRHTLRNLQLSVVGVMEHLVLWMRRYNQTNLNAVHIVVKILKVQLIVGDMQP
jgi:hypothetical protein